MPAVAINHQIQLHTCECYKCGVVFAFSEFYYEKRAADHVPFYCPNGHSQVYLSESAAERTRRELREEQARHQRTLARANEAEAEAAKLKRRINNGTCPCCKRTFKQLAMHMKHKHPEYLEKKK